MADVRLTSEVVEVLLAPAVAEIRLTSAVVEVLLLAAATGAEQVVLYIWVPV